VHWAVCTGVFGKRDVGRIEREFLDVLDFELSISEADIMAHHHTVMSLVRPAPRRSHGIPNALPHLGYSSGSPTSTESSLSPRTPSTLGESPAYVDPRSKSEQYRLHQAHFEPYPLASVPATAHVKHEKKSSHSSTLRILRSLPFPRPFGHSSSTSTSASRGESQTHSQNVTQQGRCQLLAPFAAQPPTQVYA
jgi:hypothetical protein